MSLDRITPVILTLDEEPNIGRCLARLTWARQIIVLDSGSTDRTREICAQSPNVVFSVRPFTTHAEQWNLAVSLATSRWVLALDADYLVNDELVREMASLNLESVFCAYRIDLDYMVFGKKLTASILPPRTALFDRSICRYRDDGHTQRLVVEGTSEELAASIGHDDRKPIERWLRSQIQYARLEVAKLESADREDLSRADRIRTRLWIAPWAVPLLSLLRNGVFASGWRGWYYALQRGVAEAILALCLVEERLRGSNNEN